VGVLGGLIGILAGFGKAKKLALCLTMGLITLGVVSLLLGIVAMILSQPYAVYYPLLLIGVICAVLLGTGYRSIRKRYEERELRKMKALDIS
jgi:protein-S-isoprenylcysteine O-methyltransferase Ste14